MTAILQASLPFSPWAEPNARRLPGVQPLDPAEWLHVDDAFAAQMAERERLIATVPREVHALEPSAQAAAREVLDLVVTHLRGDPRYDVAAQAVTRPDGVRVALDPEAPLFTVGRLIQEDVCLLQCDGQGGHVLTGAILCFPASWRLPEKMGRALIGIHRPVPEYDADLARRVQRLFDAIRPERPLWRSNVLSYDDPVLHQPRSEAAARRPATAHAPFIRSERQCLLRLPQSRAVVFSIHTYVVRRADLTSAQAAALNGQPEAMRASTDE